MSEEDQIELKELGLCQPHVDAFFQCFLVVDECEHMIFFGICLIEQTDHKWVYIKFQDQFECF